MPAAMNPLIQYDLHTTHQKVKIYFCTCCAICVVHADSFNCRPQSIYILARHGTRYAKLSEMDRISQRLHTIKNLITKHASNGTYHTSRRLYHTTVIEISALTMAETICVRLFRRLHHSLIFGWIFVQHRYQISITHCSLYICYNVTVILLTINVKNICEQNWNLWLRELVRYELGGCCRADLSEHSLGSSTAGHASLAGYLILVSFLERTL